MNIIKAIKSNNSAFWQTMLGVLILSPNVFYVFYQIAIHGVDQPFLRYIITAQSVAVAIYVSWSIVYNTMKKQINQALYFCYFEIFIAGCNYWLRLMFDDTGEFKFNGYIFAALAFTIMLPLSVKAYAATIKDDEEAEPVDKLTEAARSMSEIYIKDLEKVNHEYAAKIQDDQKYISHLESEVKKLEYEVQVTPPAQYVQQGVPFHQLTSEEINKLKEVPVTVQVPPSHIEQVNSATGIIKENSENVVTDWKDDDLFNDARVK